MPPRTHICTQCLRAPSARIQAPISTPIALRYASVQAVTPAPQPQRMARCASPASEHPPTQPPSHRRPEERRSQLHRQYASLLRSTPMMLIFQHNNLKATEWTSLRRELAAALRKVDSKMAAAGNSEADITGSIRFQIIKTGIFASALRVVEYFRPMAPQHLHLTDGSTSSSTGALDASPSAPAPAYTHGLSRAAHEATAKKKLSHALSPLFKGPLAVLTFPAVSTEHLQAALSIVSPQAPNFRAPTRRANPAYWEPSVQSAVQKLMLLGARVEGKALDTDGARWIGSIEGGLDGLRAQVVAMLQGVGAGVTNTLEAAGKSLYFTLEGRRGMLEEEQDGQGGNKAEGEEKEKAGGEGGAE